MIWSEYLVSSIRYSSIVIAISLLSTIVVEAQNLSMNERFMPRNTTFLEMKLQQHEKETFPNPKTVMRQSLIIPGWGQVTNGQIWKVPIIYGLIGGLSYYSVTLTKDYHDYRAAYYNSFPENTDLRFGATPEVLVGSSPNFLKDQRNFLRNRRDFIYITIALAHILNVVDAYVFAHLRSFDVSDDLSMSPSINPSTIHTNTFGSVPAITFSLQLYK